MPTAPQELCPGGASGPVCGLGQRASHRRDPRAGALTHRFHRRRRARSGDAALLHLLAAIDARVGGFGDRYAEERAQRFPTLLGLENQQAIGRDGKRVQISPANFLDWRAQKLCPEQEVARDSPNASLKNSFLLSCPGLPLRMCPRSAKSGDAE